MTRLSGRRLVIIHPYIPEYRIAFYEQLTSKLQAQGIRVMVVASDPPPNLVDRGDSTSPEWATRVPIRWIRLGNKFLAFRNLRQLHLSSSDFIIVEQAVRNLETLVLLLWKVFGGPRVAMWGHGGTYSIHHGRLLQVAKRRLTLAADWFFAYTAEGSAYVESIGFPSCHITTVQNSLDTDALNSDLLSISHADVDSFCRDHGLSPGQIGLFIGGVDERKGIDKLIDTSHRVAQALPNFRLLVLGDGRDLAKLRRLQNQGAPLVCLGRVTGRKKALALTAADILCIPEWIGLVAIEALVSGTPVVSRDNTTHAPERWYLEDGKTAIFSEDSNEDMARQMVAILQDRERLTRMSEEARRASEALDLNNFVSRFASGVVAWLGRAPKSH